MRRLTATLLVLVLVIGTTPLLQADDVELKQQVDQLVRQLEKQQHHIDALEGKLKEQNDPALQARMMQFEKELLTMRNELSQVTAAELVPGWISKDLDFVAKAIVSYHGIYRDDGAYIGDGNGVRRRQRANDMIDRHFMEYEVIFGFRKQFSSEWEAGFALRSSLGLAGDGANVLGGDPGMSAGQPYFGEDEVGIWLAYGKYTPECIPGLEIGFGKFMNPLVSTDMVWDEDITPEGVYQKYAFQVGDSPIKPFVAFAQTIAEEVNNDRDLHMFAYQAGFTWEKVADSFDWTMAAAFYDWDGFEDAVNTGNLLGSPAAGNIWPLGARTFDVYGNTVSVRRSDGAVYYDAGDFNIINIVNKANFDLTVGENTIPVEVYLDLAWNTASPNEQFDALNGNSLGTRRDRDAQSIGVVLGQLKQKGDWRFEWKYAHIEANSVVGPMADADFGFANSKGQMINGAYKVHDNIALQASLYLTEPIYNEDNTRTMTPSFIFDVIFQY